MYLVDVTANNLIKGRVFVLIYVLLFNLNRMTLFFETGFWPVKRFKIIMHSYYYDSCNADS